MGVAVAVVILNKRKFLMVKRKPDVEFYPTFWAPMHGHIQEGERVEECVRRIAKEQLDLDVEPVKEIKTLLADYGASELKFWLAKINSGQPSIKSKKLAKFKWMGWSAAVQRNLLPATKSIFRKELKELVLDEAGDGKFIVLDGIDASGKKTQTKLLLDWLKDMGYVADMISFPQYDRPFGAIVGNYLRGEYGGKDDLPPEVTALLYATDRYDFAPTLRWILKNKEWIVADRYTPANIFQVAKLKNEEEQDKVFEWIRQVESRMPQPNIVIILNQDPAVARQLHEQRQLQDYMRGLKKDVHDADTDYQASVMKLFLRLAKKLDNWHVVECMDNDELRTVAHIQEDIRNVVRRTLLGEK